MIKAETVERTDEDKIALLQDEAIKLGATITKLISTQNIVVEPWVQLKCRFGCSKFGKYKTCPPYTPTYQETRELLNCYKSAILLRQSNLKGCFLNSSIKPISPVFIRHFL